MQVVIDIDENVYTRLFDNGEEINEADRKVIETAIRKGTSLPKGHNALIDQIKLSYEIFSRADMSNEHNCYNSIIGILRDAPVIIEANKDGE